MIIQGTSFRIPLASNSIHCIVTSPPYWGLRDYGLKPMVFGGRSDCNHQWETIRTVKDNGSGGPSLKQDSNKGSRVTDYNDRATYSSFCCLCNAWLGSYGLEPTIALYVQHSVEVARECYRVLRPDGIMWWNLGDSYATSRNGRSAADTKAVGKDDRTFRDKPFSITELPAKNLCGIPWRVALALQDDGWILRTDIIWSKKNPMPESVEDRPTRAHEYIFMLTKEPYYFYDNEAIRENFADERMGNPGAYKWSYANDPETGRGIRGNGGPSIKLQTEGWNSDGSKTGRNRRTVWEIATQPYPQAHYATFPTKLVEPMILASTSARGCCPTCGRQWQRVVEKGELQAGNGAGRLQDYQGILEDVSEVKYRGANFRKSGFAPGHSYQSQTTGWRPTCSCNAGEPVPAVILDPFCGSGTVGQVARELGRRFIGIDLSAKYLQENALPRAERLTSESALSQLPMFAQLESA